MALGIETCKACGNTEPPVRKITVSDRLYGVNGLFEICFCSSCGSGWLLGSSSNLKYDYPQSEYYSYQMLEEQGLMEQIRRVIISRKMRADMPVKSKIARFLGQVLPTNLVRGIPKGMGRLLDVGCGSGGSVRDFIDAGIEVWGVDIDRRALELASLQGVQSVFGEFDTVKLPQSYFDVVRMWHSLEHMSDPLGALSKARRILRNGGVLLIGTPDISSFSARLFGANWYHLDPPRHRVLFSAEGLKRLAEKVAFRVVSISNWCDRGFLGSVLLMSSPLWRDKRHLRAFINNPILAIAGWPMDILISRVHRGDHVELTCLKDDALAKGPRL